MLEEENQNLKEKEETLNLTGKELEEYKTYLKFKNEIEKQNESQEAVQVKSQNITQNQNEDNKPNANSTTKSFRREVGTVDMDDPNYTFTEEQLEAIGYKEYINKTLDIQDIKSFRSEVTKVFIIKIIAGYVFFRSTSEMNSTGWIIFKIITALVLIKSITTLVKRMIIVEPMSSVKTKIYKYNNVVRDASWIKISNDDENFTKYYNLSKNVIENKLYNVEGRPELKRDKYTNIYQISDSKAVVVVGICDYNNFMSTNYLEYMLVIEDEDCILNLIAGEVMRERK